MRKHKLRTTALAALLAAASAGASAQAMSAAEKESLLKEVEATAKRAAQSTGLEFTGYMRSGFYTAPNGAPAGGYALGGSMQLYRLGNDGDNYFEVGIGKNFDVEGTKWGIHYMPYVYNGGTGTKQIYADISGLSFLPEATLWAGQRYHRIQDIHVVDNWLMEDGDNYGAGIDGIKVGSGKLNVAAYTAGEAGNSNANTNNAKRLNFQLRDLAVNAGGKLTLTAATVSGDFALGNAGSAFGVLHNQENFIVDGLNNSLFIQTSTGHANVTGKFYNLNSSGTAQPGANQTRIADVISWEGTRFGGQFLLGYHTISPDNNGAQIKDSSVGGRLSYGIGANTKLLGEVGVTARDIDGQSTQNLQKATVAVAFSPNTKFWTRPEFRIYVNNANWNDAARAANSTSFGSNGRRDVTTFGVQIEAWW